MSNKRQRWAEGAGRGGVSLPLEGSGPGRQPDPPLPDSLRSRPAPLGFQALGVLPPGSIARCSQASIGAPWLLPSQRALLSQVRSTSTSMSRSCPSPSRCPLQSLGHLYISRIMNTKNTAFRIYTDGDFKSSLCDLEQIDQPLSVRFLTREVTWED